MAQDRDFYWFMANHKELFDQYGPVFLIIKNQEVIGKENTFGAAVRLAKETEQEGSFIVQKCGPDASCFTDYIASMNFMN